MSLLPEPVEVRGYVVARAFLHLSAIVTPSLGHGTTMETILLKAVGGALMNR
jgi:hypothetical protein